MQALAVAGAASAAHALPPAQVQRQPGIGCGDEALDAFLGGFHRGQLTFLDSASPLLWGIAHGAACEATRHGTATIVDGGNSADPYVLAACARRQGLDPRRVLGALRITRAFTAYQLSAILEETLPADLHDYPPALLLCPCLPELYLDEDVPWHEAQALVQRAVELLKQYARDFGCAVLATNLGMTKLADRPALRAALYGADRVVRLLPARGGVGVHDGDRSLLVQPVPQGQRTLPDFHGGPQHALRVQVMTPRQLAVRGA